MTRFRSRTTPFVHGHPMNLYRKAVSGGNYVRLTSAPYANAPPYQEFSTCADDIHQGPPYRSGGLLVLNKAVYPTYYTPENRYTITMNGYHYMAEGSFSLDTAVLNSGPGLLVGSTLSTLQGNDASSYGATAWARFRPGKPKHGLGQLIAESRDIPRMLRSSVTTLPKLIGVLRTRSDDLFRRWKFMGGKRYLKDTPKTVASEFLNNQFGWLPFLGDMKSVYQFCAGADNEARKLKEQNNQWIRRRGELDVTSKNIPPAITSYSTASALQPTGSAWWPFAPITGSQGSCSRVTSETNRVWFTALMKYYIPEFDGPGWYWPAMRKAYGLSITPTLLYELTPWSWLIDWFSNVGDVVANADAIMSEGLVAKYAYIMHSRIRKSVITCSQNWLAGSVRAKFEFEWCYKNRSLCSPYSFSWDSSSLTALQISILAALGVTRLR